MLTNEPMNVSDLRKLAAMTCIYHFFESTEHLRTSTYENAVDYLKEWIRDFEADERQADRAAYEYLCELAEIDFEEAFSSFRNRPLPLLIDDEVAVTSDRDENDMPPSAKTLDAIFIALEDEFEDTSELNDIRSEVKSTDELVKYLRLELENELDAKAIVANRQDEIERAEYSYHRQLRAICTELNLDWSDEVKRASSV